MRCEGRRIVTDPVCREGGFEPREGPARQIHADGRLGLVHRQDETVAPDPASVAQSLPKHPSATWNVDLERGEATLADDIWGLENLRLPVAPMLGCFGVAPARGQAISTATSAERPAKAIRPRWSREMGVFLFNFTPGSGSNRDWAPEGHKSFVPSTKIIADVLAYEQKDRHGLNGFLLLLHVGSQRKDKTFLLLGDLLAELTNRGYTFARVDELLKF